MPLTSIFWKRLFSSGVSSMQSATNDLIPKGQSRVGHVWATLALGMPLVGTQIAQIAINTTDVVMLGWYGTSHLAAGVLATQAFFFVFIFGAGFTYAVVPMAAQAEGRGDATQLRRSVRMGFWVIILYSAVVMPLMWQVEAILLFLGQKPELAKLAGDYMHLAQWSILPALATLVFRAFFAAQSRVQIVLWSALIGTLANAVLNYAFIFGHLGAPEMGIRGAAIASLGSSMAILVMLIGWTYIVPKFRSYQLFVRFWRPDWQAFNDVVRMGIPIGLMIIAEVGLFLSASVMMGWLGTVTLAAHGIALQLGSIAFMVPLGMASAATVRVGQLYGRGDDAGLARAAHVVLVISGIFALASALLFWFLPTELIGLFLDHSQPEALEVLSIAVPLLAIAACFQFVDSMQVVGAGLLRGLNDTRVPMLIAVISYWVVGLPVAWGLGFGLGFGAQGIWWGLAIGLGVASWLLLWRFFRRERFLSSQTQSAA